MAKKALHGKFVRALHSFMRRGRDLRRMYACMTSTVRPSRDAQIRPNEGFRGRGCVGARAGGGAGEGQLSQSFGAFEVRDLRAMLAFCKLFSTHRLR